MTTKVIFAFDQDAGGITNFFELDSAVKGKLDNTIYTLGGAFSLVDVTSDVRSLTISRGRSRLLDKIESATAEILLDNRARLYDMRSTRTRPVGPCARTGSSPWLRRISAPRRKQPKPRALALKRF